MTSRRNILASIKSDDVKTANAGLWLNKYLDKKGDDDKAAKSESVKGVVNKASNAELASLYQKFFARWEQALQTYSVGQKSRVETRKARVQGRMVIGLGAKSVLETSVALHHTYGVPYIPGSALKGMARHFADAQRVEGWEPRHTRIVFGNDKKSEDVAAAGFITFFDAFYVPGSGEKGQALHADVMTVHHAHYYMQGDVAPADWDDPNPVPFISATGAYLLALAGPENWLNPTFRLLELALEEEGVGGKTSSGYGRMKFI
ncbi:MAG: type III-B CRISPR module RAMP protein Cmr6 [Blastocatellia bacterium]